MGDCMNIGFWMMGSLVCTRSSGCGSINPPDVERYLALGLSWNDFWAFLKVGAFEETNFSFVVVDFDGMELKKERYMIE